MRRPSPRLLGTRTCRRVSTVELQTGRQLDRHALLLHLQDDLILAGAFPRGSLGDLLPFAAAATGRAFLSCPVARRPKHNTAPTSPRSKQRIRHPGTRVWRECNSTARSTADRRNESVDPLGEWNPRQHYPLASTVASGKLLETGLSPCRRCQLQLSSPGTWQRFCLN